MEVGEAPEIELYTTMSQNAMVPLLVEQAQLMEYGNVLPGNIDKCIAQAMTAFSWA